MHELDRKRELSSALKAIRTKKYEQYKEILSEAADEREKLVRKIEKLEDEEHRILPVEECQRMWIQMIGESSVVRDCDQLGVSVPWFWERKPSE